MTHKNSGVHTDGDAGVRASIIQTLPLFEMLRMRGATTARRHSIKGFAAVDPSSRVRWMNHFTHTQHRLGPTNRQVVSPNNDTLYSNAWLDLSEGPVVVQTPDMGQRYWTLGLLDAWTNPFAYVGRRTTGNRFQRTLVHGPGWKGPVPADVSQVIAAPGYDVWIIGRILVDDTPEDLAQVHKLQGQIVARCLDGTDAAMPVDTLVDRQACDVPPSSLYREVVDHALTRNPVPAGESLQWPPSESELMTELPRVFAELRGKEQPRALGSGWALPVAVRAHWSGDVLTRARVARNLIGALGIEEAMYPTAEVDADGQALSGLRTYELRFPPGGGPRVNAFWSLTMYRRSDCLLVANPISRYSIGDRTPGLRYEDDGSLVIRLQASPPERECNWLPAPPGDLFYVVLRLYQPQAEHLDFRFDYPPIRVVMSARRMRGAATEESAVKANRPSSTPKVHGEGTPLVN
jgi:hypothetical protein